PSLSVTVARKCNGLILGRSIHLQRAEMRHWPNHVLYAWLAACLLALVAACAQPTQPPASITTATIAVPVISQTATSPPSATPLPSVTATASRALSPTRTSPPKLTATPTETPTQVQTPTPTSLPTKQVLLQAGYFGGDGGLYVYLDLPFSRQTP